MVKLQSALLAGTIMLAGVAALGFNPAQAKQPIVRLQTEPTAEQLRPIQAGDTLHQKPARLTLKATDTAGEPLKDAKVRLQILTPPYNPWFPTDFPIVEGTKLLELETSLENGTIELQQMLPIRGNYQLVATLEPTVANQFQPNQQTLSLSVAENSIKYRNLGILVVSLLAAGLVGGWVMGNQSAPRDGEIAPEKVRLLLSGATVVAIVALLTINLSAERSASHTHEHSSQVEELPVQRSQGLELRLSGEHHATVGTPASFTAQVLDAKTAQPITDVRVTVTATQLEDSWIAFSYQGKPDSIGQLNWQEQFFDGAPHQVTVQVSPLDGAKRQFQPFEVTQVVDVEGVAPPLQGRLIVLGYFVAILLCGLFLGLRGAKRLRPAHLQEI